MNDYVIPFEQLGMHDVERVGGKNASLGEMISALSRLGVQVPGGFATTAHAYREFLAQGSGSASVPNSPGSTSMTSSSWPPPARASASGFSPPRSRRPSTPRCSQRCGS